MKLNLTKPVVVLRQKAFSFPNTWSQCVQAQCRAKVEEILHLLHDRTFISILKKKCLT